MQIGLIGIIGEQLKQDPWGTLQQVAALGYDGIEGAGDIAARADASFDQLKTHLDKLGLAAIAQGGVFTDPDDEKLANAIDAAKKLESQYVVSYWGDTSTKDNTLKLAEALNRVGGRCREEGLKFCYHNHNQEFATFDGKRALDLIAENTSEQNVLFELDVAWVTYGSADPVATIRQYAGRCPLLHIKDLVEVPEGGEAGNEGRGGTQFTEVGTGVVDIEGSIAAGREAGAEWAIVEQDRPRELGPMDSIRVSFENLKRIVDKTA